MKVESKIIRVLAIETSCDETAVAILERNPENGSISVCSNAIYSQMDLHRAYGGVYPELASREHVAKIGHVLETAIQEARRFSKSKVKSQKSEKIGISNSEFGISNQDWLKANIDLIAVTAGPGLIGSLLVGVNAAKTLAYAFDKPILPIHHHEGHIAAAWLQPSSSAISNFQFPISKQKSGDSNLQPITHNLEPTTSNLKPVPTFPALALIVSGGHTQLVLIQSAGQFEIIGRTRDDAAGEAFDKVARLLGLDYPGGPAISALAATYNIQPTTHHLKLPRPMLDSGDLNFSFSGLKTAVAQLIKEQSVHLGGVTPVSSEVDGTRGLSNDIRAAIAHEFQEAVVDVLVTKTERAIIEHQPRSFILAGGVAANTRLRERINEAIRNSSFEIRHSIYIPPFAYCTDNAAMIGAAALLRLQSGQTGNWRDIHADDRLALGTQ